MKRIHNMLTLVAAAALGMAIVSCEDEPDKYEIASGLPSVDYIRCLSTEVESSSDDENTHYTYGELVTSASPQQTLCLVGTNLRSVYELWFNDKQAILNTSYITDNTLIVDVPSSVPDYVTNKIYMITQAGDTVTHDFEIVISAPTLSAMSNEYAPAGTTATITGNYLVDDPGVPLTIAFVDENGNPLYVGQETIKVNSSYTSVSFTVPEGAAEGPITVTSIYGSTTTSWYYLDTRGMLFDFDGLTGLGNHGWHDRTITSDDTSIAGNFVQLGDGNTTLDAAGGWNDSQFSFEYWPGNWEDPETFTASDGLLLYDVADFSNWSNLSFKFEMYIPESSPWAAGAMQIIFAGTKYVSYGNAGVKDLDGNTLAGCNNSYFQVSADGGYDLPRALYRPWTTTGSYDTGGEWETVSLPISSSFIYNFDGSGVSASFTETDFASLVIFVCGGGVSGTDCTPLIKIDNIRVVPNN